MTAALVITAAIVVGLGAWLKWSVTSVVIGYEIGKAVGHRNCRRNYGLLVRTIDRLVQTVERSAGGAE